MNNNDSISLEAQTNNDEHKAKWDNYFVDKMCKNCKHCDSRAFAKKIIKNEKYCFFSCKKIGSRCLEIFNAYNVNIEEDIAFTSSIMAVREDFSCKLFELREANYE